jgi:hypothetical protein
VARQTKDRESLVNEALAAYAAANEPRNDLALMSIVGTIGESDPSLRSAVLDRIAADSRLVEALPAASLWPPVETRDAERLLRAYADGKLTGPPRANLVMGRPFANVDDRLVRALAETFLDRGWYSSVVGLLTFGVDQSERFDDLFARVIVESGFIRTKMEDLHEWSLFEVIRRIVNGGNTAFAVAIAGQMMDLSLADASYGTRQRVAELWPCLFGHEAVWFDLTERYATLDRRGRLKLLVGTQYMPQGTAQHRLAIEAVSIEDLLAFASFYENEVPRFLAQYAKMVATNEDGSLRITTLMSALLKRFGERDDVLASLAANLHSFASVGPLAAYYSVRLALVDDIPTFGKSKIGAWKEQLREGLDQQRQRAQSHDEEMHGGIF